MKWSGNTIVGDAEALTSDISNGLRVAYARNINFNSGNTDNPIVLPIPKGVTRYRINGIRISGASAAINSATCGVFTGPGGTGVAVVAANTPVTVTQTGVDTNNNLQSLTIINQNIVAFGDATLYFQIQNPEGSAAQANISVTYELLSFSSVISEIAPPHPPYRPFSSAGVFDSTGFLVRTLWSAQLNNPNTANPAAVWDGTFDDGSVAPTGTYTVQVLSSNVTYTWEGVIGNSGLQPHVASVPHGVNASLGVASILEVNFPTHGETPVAMTITPGGEIYICSQYDERYHVLSVCTTADPQTNNTIIGNGFRQTWLGNGVLCSDGTNLYSAWNGAYSNGKTTIVWGINQQTKLPAVFSSGTNETGNVQIEYGTIWGIGDLTDTGDSASNITGLAVQQSGNFLFFSRQFIDAIYTANKTSGASLQTFTSFIDPGSCATNPVTGDLWQAHNLVTATFAAYVAINLRIRQGSSVTAKLTAASFTYTPPSGYSALNGTLDPTTIQNGIVLSGGNLTATNPSSGISTGNYVYSQNKVTKGYFEVLVNTDILNETDNGIIIGIAGNTGPRDTVIPFPGFDSLGYDPQSIGWANSNQSFGAVYGPNGGFRGTMQSVGFTTGDNIGVAFDTIKGKIWWRKNGGNWNNQSVADPVANTSGLTLQTVSAPTKTPQISKMTVDVSGNLTDSGVEINGVGGIAAGASTLSISPDGSTLLATDNITQQVKAFNTSDGSVKTAWGVNGTLGDLNGYANGAAVSNTRYLFSSPNSFSTATPVPIAYAPDGSFWFLDVGNYRLLHFSAGNSPTYIEQIKYSNLADDFSAVCYNDDTRVFDAFMEYKIDYSKPLDNGVNGSWTLVNNWFNNIPPGAFSQFSLMKYTGTFSNGRTYAPFYDSTIAGGNTARIMELTPAGLRDTGVQMPWNGVYVDHQFNLWTLNSVSGGQQAVYSKNALLGFDGSNNPIFQVNPNNTGSYPVFLTSAVLPNDFPDTGNFNNINSNIVEALANGVIPVFNQDGSIPSPNVTAMHCGGINSVTGLVKFQCHPGTGANHGGENTFLRFPDPPYFNTANFGNFNRPGTGNGAVPANAGGAIYLKPGMSDFFTSYPGESWGNNQTNVWSHWHQSGLLVGRFGVAAPYFGSNMFLDGSFTHWNGPNFYLNFLMPPSITVAAWINPSVLDTNLRSVWTTLFNQGGDWITVLGVVGSQAAVYYNSAGGGGPSITGGSIAINNWYRLVVTISATGAVLYVNGVSVGTGAGATLKTQGLNLTNIGGQIHGTTPIGSANPFFGGAISDVAVWNTALTPSQVASLQTQRANTIGANANLVGYWPMLGTEFEIDQSGNLNSPFGGMNVVAGPPGFPLFNGVNKARSFNGTSDAMLLSGGFYPDAWGPYFTGNPPPGQLGDGSSFRGMPGMAGNAKWGGLAFQNGNYYVYHNDEWYHGGKHRWRVNNVGTVALSKPVTVNWNSSSYVAPSAGPPNLLAALPYDTWNLPNNTANWVRNPTSDIDPTTNALNVYTNAITPNRHSPPDLVMQGYTNSAGINYTLSNSWVRAGSGSWSMVASVFYTGIGDIEPPNRFIYVDILDNAGKKILRFNNTAYNANNLAGMFANNTLLTPLPLLSGPAQVYSNYWKAERQLLVSADVSSQTMQATYGDFSVGGIGVLDVGANITKPSGFMITLGNDVGYGSGTYMGLSFTKLIFNI